MQARSPKVDEHPQPGAAGRKVVRHLGNLFWPKSCNRLQLDDHVAETQEIGAICATDLLAPIVDWHRNLALTGNSTKGALNLKGTLIRGFEEGRAKGIVNRHCRADNRKRVGIRHESPYDVPAMNRSPSRVNLFHPPCLIHQISRERGHASRLSGAVRRHEKARPRQRNVGARLGQHFLRDARVLDDILTAAHLKPGQRVLEVGPGPGNLTERLVAAVGASGEVVAIEADRDLAAALEGKWPNLHVVAGDAVKADLASLGRFDRIVANLPYLISGPITISFLELLANPGKRWSRAVLMYQREFALRLLAQPSTHDYGRLTVQASRWCRITRLRDVPAGAFNPPPRVESMLVVLEPHAKPLFEVRDERVWQAVLDGTFQRRRKQLRNSLPAAVGGVGIPFDVAVAALEKRGWLERRPENLAPGEFAVLANDLAVAGKTA